MVVLIEREGAEETPTQHLHIKTMTVSADKTKSHEFPQSFTVELYLSVLHQSAVISSRGWGTWNPPHLSSHFLASTIFTFPPQEHHVPSPTLHSKIMKLSICVSIILVKDQRLLFTYILYTLHSTFKRTKKQAVLFSGELEGGRLWGLQPPLQPSNVGVSIGLWLHSQQ